MKIHYHLRKLLACTAVAVACTCGTSGAYAADTYTLNGKETAWPSGAIRPSWRADGNEIIIDNVQQPSTWVDGSLSYTSSKPSSNNTITITESNLYQIRGGVSSPGAAENNTVKVINSTIERGSYGSITGGSGGGTGATSENTVTVEGSTIKGDVAGGKNSDNKVHSITNNTVTATDSKLEGNYIYGGYSQSQQEGTVVSGNRVELTNTSHGNYIYGGNLSGAGTVTDNHIIVTGGTKTDSGTLYGGNAKGGTLKGNTVTLQDGTSGRYVYGARSSGSSAVAHVEGNDVVIKNSTFALPKSLTIYSDPKIYGGSIEATNSTGETSKALNNSVTIEGSTVYATIYGAYTKGLSEVSGNSVTIVNSTVTCGNGGIYGVYNEHSGKVSGSSVTIDGSTVSGKVYGSYTHGSKSTGNTVTLKNECDLSAATIYGSDSGSSGNTLNVENFTGTVKSLSNFETINVLGTCDISTETLKLADGATFRTNADSQFAVTGTLTLNGACTISMDGLSTLGTGSYTLLSYGSLSGSAAWDFDMTGGNSLLTYTLSSKAGELSLLVARNEEISVTLTWDATLADGVWSEDDSVGSLWNSEGGPLAFKAEDSVLFEGGQVTIQGEVTPGGIWVQGSDDTTFSGEGSITGDAALEKNGSGTLTINNANTYTGDTTVNGGTLVLNNAQALGAGAVKVNGGTLCAAQSTSVSGGITAGGTGVVSIVGNETTLSGNVTLADSAQLAIEAGASLKGNLTVTSDTAKVRVEATHDYLDTLSKDTSLTITSGTVDWSTSGLAEGGDIVVLGDIFNGYRTDVTVDKDSGITLKVGSEVLLLDTDKSGVWQTGGSDDLWLNHDSPEVSETFMNNDTVVIDTSHDGNTEDVLLSVGGEVRAAEVLIYGDLNLTIRQADDHAEADIGGVDTAIVKEGKGITTIETANSFGGGMTVKEGGIIADNNQALGKNTVTMMAGTSLEIADDKQVANTVFITGGGTVTVVNPDAVGMIVQEKGTHVAKGEAGSEDIILGVNESFMVVENESQLPKLKLAMKNIGGTLAPGIVMTTSSTGTSHNLTFAGGTLRLTAANEAYRIGGLTTIASGSQPSVIDLSTWTSINATDTVDRVILYCDNGLIGGDLVYRQLKADLRTELDAYEYYAHFSEKDVEGQKVLVLTFVNPGINSEVASTLSLNQSRAYSALCAIAETRPEKSELAETAAYVGTAPATEAGEVAEILDAVSGEEYATMMAGQIEGNLAHLRRLRAHMGHGHLLGNSKSGLAAFANAYSDTAEVDADARGLGYKRNEWGAQVGVEQEIAENMGIGLALSVGRANVTPTDGVRYHEDNRHLDAYHFMRKGGWENRVSVGVGFHEHDLARRGNGGSMMSAGNVDGTSFNFTEEISYRLPVTESVTLRPFFAIESSVNSIDGFTEGGNSTLALCGDSQDAWATDLTLGLSAEKRFAMLERAPRATAELHAGITASVGDTTSDLRMHFAGAPSYSFEQSSADRNRWGMNLGAGVNVPVTQFTSVYANAEAIFRGDSSSVDAQLGVHVNF